MITQSYRLGSRMLVAHGRKVLTCRKQLPAVACTTKAFKSTTAVVDEVIEFPDSVEESKPVLLNSKEHAVGYLSKVLNARVYDAAIESELQHAKNLSAVRLWRC